MQAEKLKGMSPLRKVFGTNNGIKTVKKNMKSFTLKSRFNDCKILYYR